MRLLRLEMSNFKGFRNLELDLDGKSTIFAGINGAGKSTSLSAIAFLMYVWLNRLNPAQSKSFESIPVDSITVGESRLFLRCEVKLDGELYCFERTRNAPVLNTRRGRYSINSGQYSAFVDHFRARYLAESSKDMPIFAHYGVNRSVTSVPTRIVSECYSDKLAALERSSDNGTSFKNFFEWYREQEAEEVIAIRENGRYSNPSLALVRKVISDVVDGVSGIHIRRNPTRMTAIKNDEEMRIDYLSDGEKCTLALFGDLVKRLALANPGLENPLEGEGIVLIDEIDLHLHPAWQRLILGKLNRHFPNIQFIVTTHSPQVLGEANDDYTILLIDSETHEVRRVPRLDVFDSNMILEEYLGTSSQNPFAPSHAEEIIRLVERGDYEKAKRELGLLAELTGYASKDYIAASSYLKRRLHSHEIH